MEIRVCSEYPTLRHKHAVTITKKRVTIVENCRNVITKSIF